MEEIFVRYERKRKMGERRPYIYPISWRDIVC